MSGDVMQQGRYQVGRDALFAQFAQNDQSLGLDFDTTLVVQLLDPELVGVKKTLEDNLGLFVHRDWQLGGCKTKNNNISNR